MRPWRFWLVCCLALPLAACDGSTERKAVAECKLKKEATYPDGTPDLGFIRTCMQAKGYVLDYDLLTVGGRSCVEEIGPAEMPECYHEDTWLSAQLAKRHHKKW
jgi:hypothetical protein